MKKMLIPVLINTLLLICCHKDDSKPFIDNRFNNVEGNAEILWRTSLSKGNAITEGYGNTTLVGNNEIVFFSYNTEEQDKSLLFLNKKNGEIKGEWNDWFDKRYTVGFIPYTFKNYFVCADADGSYIIDLTTKKTIKKNYSKAGARADIVGNEELFFYREFPASAIKGGKGDASLMIGNLYTNEVKELFNVNRFKDTSNAGISMLYYIQKNTTDTKIFFTYGDWNEYRKIETPNVHSWLSIFSINENKMIDSLPLLDDRDYGSGRGQVIVNSNKIYTSGQYLYCYDTDKLQWHLKMNISPDGFTLDENSGVIYVSVDHTIKAINAETGAVLWTSENLSNETCKPFVMNGVVYVTTAKLWALDAQTGKVLWCIRTGDDDGTDFQNHNVTGDGERIYVSSDRYAYCFKAAQ